MASKDEILANFQACSGIEDYGEAYTKLEQFNWNLLDAVNSVLPEDTQVVNNVATSNAAVDPFRMALEDNDVTIIEPTPLNSHNSIFRYGSVAGASQGPALPNYPPSQDIPSTSQSNEMMHIEIQVLFDSAADGNTFPLEILPSTTFGELKSLLHQLIGVAPCKQILEGFKKPMNDESVIEPSIIPEHKIICINTLPDSPHRTNNFYDRINGPSNEEYILLIHDENATKDYRLNFPGNKLIKDIKSDIFDLTLIPIRHQQWTGWPPNLKDDDKTTLAMSGVGKQHNLTVRKLVKDKPSKSSGASTSTMEVQDSKMDDNTSSTDEFEDAPELLNDDDDFLEMIDVVPSSKPQTLIPATIEDDLMGVFHFCEEFTNRYGNCTPMFYQGTLENAFKESVQLPAKHKKLLAVYLHNDNSVSSNVFCSQVLCDISIVDYLSNNFIIWGWDLTHESNKARLLNLVITHFGSMAASTVRSLSIDKLPALLVITRMRGTCEVLNIIHGNWVLDEVMTALLSASEMFEEQRLQEVSEEDAREEREAMKAEQDAAYLASLEADRAKAIAKQQKEDDVRLEKERQESIRNQEEMIKEAVIANLMSNIPDEPGPDCTEPVCRFRFRIPGGELLNRSFLLSTPLEIVLNFLHVKGYPASDYKCLQSWPRRDITTLDTSKSLSDHKFPLQETLNLEER